MNPAAPSVTLKHWRAFGQAEWQHVREGLLGLALGSLLPVIVFYSGYRLWSFSAAVLLVFAWSAALFTWHQRRTGRWDVFSATTLVFACTKALAGVASQNPTLYLGWPSIENLAYATVFLGSALAGRPVLALYARRLYPLPAGLHRTDVFRRAFLVVSVGWFAGNLLRAALRLLLLRSLPLEAFLAVDAVAGWPISASLVAFTAWYPLRALREAGLVAQRPETEEAVEVLEAIERAVDEPAVGVA